MLNIIEYGKDEYDFPSLLVLGCFDAIHIGHRDLIKKAKLQAKINGLDLGVMLFRNGKGGNTVYTFEERLAILEEYKVKFVLVIDFTDEFKSTSPEDFLRNVEEKVNVKAYMSGKDFRFGAKAKGKSATLKNYAEDEENGVWYMPVKDVTVGDEKVSTTLIKSYLGNGDIENANALLGEPFYVSGEVVKGEGRGATIGYPTVNIVYPADKYPIKQGVYKVKSVIGEREYEGIANYGGRPTFGDDSVFLEVHFADFDGDLYGQTLKISFYGYIRDIETFSSAEELAGQLSKDKSGLNISDKSPAQEQVEVSAENTEVPAENTEVPVENTEVPAQEQREEQDNSPVEEQEDVSLDEYKNLESGFGDIVAHDASEEGAEDVPPQDIPDGGDGGEKN